jgi:hypothetical protein
MIKKPFICLILSICSLGLLGQKGYEIGGCAGVAYYFGDLNTSYSLSRPGPAIGLIGRYNFNNRLALKFSANYGLINARDADSDNPFERARNLSFRSGVFDGSLQFEFNFFPYVHGSDDHFFTPYLFTGLSVFRFNPKAEYQGEWVRLQPLGTEGQFVGEEYSKVQPAFNFGIGLKYDVSYEWSINVEFSGRWLFTDYLDDVSKTYPDMIALESFRGELGELAVALSDRSIELQDQPIGEFGRQRGNSSSDDTYNFLTVGFVYYIGTLQCPNISKPDY